MLHYVLRWLAGESKRIVKIFPREESGVWHHSAMLTPGAVDVVLSKLAFGVALSYFIGRHNITCTSSTAIRRRYQVDLPWPVIDRHKDRRITGHCEAHSLPSLMRYTNSAVRRECLSFCKTFLAIVWALHCSQHQHSSSLLLHSSRPPTAPCVTLPSLYCST